jgi:hypothetical protein
MLFGKGKFGPLYLQAKAAAGNLVKIASVNTQGSTEFSYVTLAGVAPFDAVDARLALNRRLGSIPGVQIPDRYAVDARWPRIQLALLAHDEAQSTYFAILDKVAEELATGRLTD